MLLGQSFTQLETFFFMYFLVTAAGAATYAYNFCHITCHFLGLNRIFTTKKQL
jgi:hypothetical protein